MGIFKRLRDMTMASVNDLLDKAEDPIKMLNQFLRDMEEDIMEAEAAVAKQIAIEKKFKLQFEESEEMVTKRTEQAMKALESGNEDLARRALEDKKEHQGRYDELKRQYDLAKTNADQLRSQLTEMKDEFNKMKNKKDLLIARAETAKAQKQINQAMSGFGTDNAAKGFDRMSEKVLQMEAEAQASGEIRAKNRSLDDELDKLGGSSSGIDDELAAMRAKLAEKKQS
ncbi:MULTISPECIES: PspA/IM30 family protein [unclassified Paenibacillus]|jgi:phage shock protein A|uniref:PspA/IM30 family protein n=1 Tax=unclassified Paenibacillus TaxID=185978 RepID=UPI00070E155E|nr:MULTISPECIES: PspA/IM30 family protein [unclassified Paenibacillus]KQX51741.1 phage shock protein A [Paenibacillus sp. Root444D2]KRE40652.1 phage shock protein A [Paenibacillus sp. Soil724D2]MDQ0896653.1 phage shock protein A [Paenibacillus sp. V4I7]MDQ0917240.1 phage shock protein A [Paenibacillus sp. V4I5]